MHRILEFHSLENGCYSFLIVNKNLLKCNRLVFQSRTSLLISIQMASIASHCFVRNAGLRPPLNVRTGPSRRLALRSLF